MEKYACRGKTPKPLVSLAALPPLFCSSAVRKRYRWTGIIAATQQKFKSDTAHLIEEQLLRLDELRRCS